MFTPLVSQQNHEHQTWKWFKVVLKECFGVMERRNEDRGRVRTNGRKGRKQGRGKGVFFWTVLTKMPITWLLVNTRFSHFWRMGSPKSQCPQIHGLARACFLAGCLFSITSSGGRG